MRLPTLGYYVSRIKRELSTAVTTRTYILHYYYFTSKRAVAQNTVVDRFNSKKKKCIIPEYNRVVALITRR